VPDLEVAINECIAAHNTNPEHSSGRPMHRTSWPRSPFSMNCLRSVQNNGQRPRKSTTPRGKHYGALTTSTVSAHNSNGISRTELSPSAPLVKSPLQLRQPVATARARMHHLASCFHRDSPPRMQWQRKLRRSRLQIMQICQKDTNIPLQGKDYEDQARGSMFRHRLVSGALRGPCRRIEHGHRLKA
jgi:hypothetical protein